MDRTSLGVLRRELVTGLAHNLKRLHFTGRGSRFCRVAPPGRHVLDIEIVTYPSVDLSVRVDVTLRHDGIQNLIEEFLAPGDACLRGQTVTVGCDLGYIQGSHIRLWKVARASDVDPVLRGMMEAITTVALPYFERFASTAEILRVTSLDHGREVINAPFDVARAQTAIAAAYLLGSRDEFDALVRRKAEYLTHESHQLVETDSFFELAAALSQRWHTARRDANTL